MSLMMLGVTGAENSVFVPFFEIANGGAATNYAPAGATNVRIGLWGGGGGGGSSGPSNGAGAGGYSEHTQAVVLNDAFAWQVGGAVTQDLNGNPSSCTGPSSLNMQCGATNGVTGGTASGGNVSNVAGGNGATHTSNNGGSGGSSSAGSSNLAPNNFAGVGGSGGGKNSDGSNGGGPGGGGGGAGRNASNGGTGAAGKIVFYWT